MIAQLGRKEMLKMQELRKASLLVLLAAMPALAADMPRKKTTLVEDDIVPVVVVIDKKVYPVVAEVDAKAEHKTDRYRQVWKKGGGKPYIEIKKGETRFVENAKTSAAYDLFYATSLDGDVKPLPKGQDSEAKVKNLLVAGDKKAETVTLKYSKSNDETSFEPVFYRRYGWYNGYYGNPGYGWGGGYAYGSIYRNYSYCGGSYATGGIYANGYYGGYYNGCYQTPLVTYQQPIVYQPVVVQQPIVVQQPAVYAAPVLPPAPVYSPCYPYYGPYYVMNGCL